MKIPAVRLRRISGVRGSGVHLNLMERLRADLPVLESAIEQVLTNLPVCFGNEAQPSISLAHEFRKSA